MFQEVIGIESVSFTNQSTKENVFGVRLYVSTKLNPPDLGYSVHEYFIKDHNCSMYHLGEIVAVLLEPTRSGKVRCTGVIYPESLNPAKKGGEIK